METDFYKILDIDKNASQDEVKKAYRKYAMKWHPDHQQGKSDTEKKEAEEKFKEGQAAYECLSDPEKRKIYDEYGIEGLKGHAQQGGFSEGGMSEGLAEFLRQHMQGFGFHFGFGDDEGFGFNPFGNNKRSKKRTPPSNNVPEDGRSYRVRMEIDLEDVIFGNEKEFTIDGFEVCPECHGHKCDGYEECSECHGTGTYQRIQGNTIFQTSCHKCGGSGFTMKKPCKKCNGNGRIETKKTYKVKIPKGISEDGQLRIKGGAEPGLCGGQNGDLLIHLVTKPHAIFNRIGVLDLEVTTYVNPLISLFGGYVSFATPYGIMQQYLSAGTKNGLQFKFSNYGIRRENLSGDLYVNVIYDKLNINSFSKEEQQILQKAALVIDNNSKCRILANEQLEKIKNSSKLSWKNNIKT